MRAPWLLAIVAACRAAPEPAPIAQHAPAPPPSRPRPPRKVITATSIETLEPIRFVGTSATIDPVSFHMLDALAQTLRDDSDIALLEVDAYGQDAPASLQQQLAEHRARTIVQALVHRHVPPTRLRFRGEPQAPGGAGNQPVFVVLAWKQP